MMEESRDAAYFEWMYLADSDPWRFETTPHKHAKYARTVAAVEGRHYISALEVGCSIGVLPRHIAPFCNACLALDITEMPLMQARERCRDASHIQFAQMTVSGDWPEGEFDLILLSEVLYFLSAGDIRATAERVRDCQIRDARIPHVTRR